MTAPSAARPLSATPSLLGTLLLRGRRNRPDRPGCRGGVERWAVRGRPAAAGVRLRRAPRRRRRRDRDRAPQRPARGSRARWPRGSPHMSRPVAVGLDVLLGGLLALNAGLLGVAFGGYGGRLLAAVWLHGPLELAAFSLAGGAYLAARARRLTGRALAVAAASVGRAAACRRPGRGHRLQPAMRPPVHIRSGRRRRRARSRARAAGLRLRRAATTSSAPSASSPPANPSPGRPPPKPGRGRRHRRTRSRARWTAPSAPLRLAGSGCARAAARCSLVARAARRRRRARELATYELRLGRDDLANPFRVQEAFEGIIGAISARWYERLLAGQDHFALEVHRLPDRSIRYTLALPRAAGARRDRAARGPLPRRATHRGRRPSRLGAVGVAPKEAALVCAVAADAAQLRARLQRVAGRAARLARGQPHRPARADPRAGIHARARAAAAQAPRTRPQPGRPGRPARPRHGLGDRGQGAQGGARDPAPLAVLLRPARRRRADARRSGASPVCSRSCARRTSWCAARCGCAAAFTRDGSSGRYRTRCRGCAPGWSRPRSSPQSGNYRARGPSSPAFRARHCGAPWRHPRSAATRRAGCSSTSTAQSGSTLRTASSARRSWAARGRARPRPWRPASRSTRATTSARS